MKCRVRPMLRAYVWSCSSALLFACCAHAQQGAQTPVQLLAQAERSARIAEEEAENAGESAATAAAARVRAVAAYDDVAEAYRQLRAVHRRDETDDATVEAARKHLVAARDAVKRARAASSERAEQLEIFPFFGFGVDTFSGSEVLSYLNPQDSGDSKTRETMGVSFQYPLYGSNTSRRFGVWLYGQTLHGVRSTDIDCNYNQGALLNPRCPTAAELPATPNQTALYILRNASTLEGMIGVRFEFQPLQGGNASLYISKQAGFVAVEDDDDDAADIHHVAFGARVREGRFRNSYIEFGDGRNDLFKLDSRDRKKINARVVARFVTEDAMPGVRDPSDWLSRGFFFAHITADVDGGPGGDAVQSFIGVAFCPWGNGKCGAQ